jgi:hypothetical protein
MPTALDLPAFGLANTTTAFATLLSGCGCLWLSWALGPQPRRWRLAYWSVVVTGVFTITLHGFGETAPVFGPRWLWAMLDTGSNIVVAWALALAVLGDYYSPEAQRRGRLVLSLTMLVGLTWHVLDELPGAARTHLIALGPWGGFYAGETCLILMAFCVVALLAYRHRQIHQPARRVLAFCVGVFLFGLLCATAANDVVLFPFFAVHALWHLVSATGFLSLWAYNHVRLYHADAISK